MEEELEVLKGFVKAMRREEERASADLGGVAGAVGVKKGARRRVGAEAPLEEEIGEVFDDDDDDDDDDDVYDDDGDDDEEGLRQEAAARAARINIAAPKMTHPCVLSTLHLHPNPPSPPLPLIPFSILSSSISLSSNDDAHASTRHPHFISRMHISFCSGS
jgi:hypothetical protein